MTTEWPRLSCADSAFPRLTHATALAVIRDLGIPAVDVCCFSGYDHNPPELVLDDPERAADSVRGRLDRAELAVADVFAIVGSSFQELAPNHPDAAVREKSLECFTRFVAFGQRLGAPGLTILPGTPFEGVDERASLELAATELSLRAEIAGDAGLRLAIEPHYESVVATPAATLELLERSPDVGLALDYSHFVFQGIPQEEVDPLLAHTRHLHLRQAAPGAMQVRAREGTIDFARIRDTLQRLGYGGYFAVEYQWEEGWLDFTHVDCISETAEMRDLILQQRAT